MQLTRLNTKQIVPLVTLGVALTFIYIGIMKLGFWSEVNGPMPGFFPAIMGSIMVLASIIAFVQSFKEEKAEYSKEVLLVVLGTVSVIISSYIIGLIPSALIYVIAWLKIIEKESWKNTLKVFAVISTIVIGVFVLWLKVPFPKGILGELVWGWFS